MAATSYQLTGGATATAAHVKSNRWTITLNAGSDGESVTVEAAVETGTQPLIYLDDSNTAEATNIVEVTFAAGETTRTFEVKPRQVEDFDLSFVNNFSATDPETQTVSVFAPPIDELIAEEIVTTLQAVTQGATYVNTLVVEHERATPNPSIPSNPNHVYCLLVPGDVTAADESPLRRSDWISTWFLMCYCFESENTGGRWDRRMRTIHWDVRKALMSDYQRGTNPITGNKTAIWTRIPVVRPMDLDQPQHRGVIIQIDVLFRTALDDGYTA